MTKTKALRLFIKKFFNWESNKMTVSDVLLDAIENGSASGGGSTREVIFPETTCTVGGFHKDDVEYCGGELGVMPDDILQYSSCYLTVDGEEIVLKAAELEESVILMDAFPPSKWPGSGFVLVTNRWGDVWAVFNDEEEHTVKLEGIRQDSGGGSSSSIMIIGIEEDAETGNRRLDSTVGQIRDSMTSGTPVFVRTYDDNEAYMMPVLSVISEGNETYAVVVLGGSYTDNVPQCDFFIGAEDDYPSI